MRWSRTLQLLEVHCEGEIGRVVTGGLLDLPGGTLAGKLDHINRVDDSLRRFLVFEPRGAPAGSVNLLLPPDRPEADAAFIVLQADQAHAMSGSNAICVTTALLESGMVAMTEPQSTVLLDTAAGLVTATADCRDGRCERVHLDMVPAFVEELEVQIEGTAWGRISADIAFGGVYYALVDSAQVGLGIEPGQARDLATAGMEILAAVNGQLDVRHPTIPEIAAVAYVMFRAEEPDGAVRTCTVLPPGRVDRSPCGTGSSANLACLHRRGRVKVGDRLVSRSIIDSEFQVTLKGTTRVGDREAVLPGVSGRAWIYGLQQLGLDPDDPFPKGFVLSDTWGPGSAKLS